MHRICFTILLMASVNSPTYAQVSDSTSDHLQSFAEFVDIYCVDCHSSADQTAGLDLESFDFGVDQFNQTDFDPTQWELIWRRLASGQMPPVEASRPTEREYANAIDSLVDILGARAKAFPRPGRTESLRRLTRFEYKNAIRDLLAIEIDEKEWLPKDESSHGFDNITVTELSPLLMNRYLTAAQKISRAAIGSNASKPAGITIRLPADMTQETHVDGLPLGTRGGTVFKHHFPQTGDYQVEIRLMRDRDEKVEGLNREHQIDVLLDRKRMHQFTVKPPKDRQDYTHSDSHLNVRIPVDAGTHEIGVTFPRKSSSLLEIKRQPFDASYNRHRHPRPSPAIFQISVVGPFDAKGTDQTVSRQKIFGVETPTPNDREPATSIIKRFARLAYRRPVSAEDLETPLEFFQKETVEGGFDNGIELAITSILINPNFLFRIESEPDNRAGGIFKISDIELASRLSFFLWSSIPDDELLTLAADEKLSKPNVLRQQVQRMLRDPRAVSLANNFAAQWLYLRNLESMPRDLRLFPDFDENLRQAFRVETELLFRDVLENGKSAIRLLDAKHTYLNERLATHYDIPNIKGSQFRRVDLHDYPNRGGILRHGSILSVTSYATRTSPTIRGSWILENILGTPPPPPPPNVPNLDSKSSLEPTTVRERLAMHRENPACASCHELMDPIGFALENYDAVGRWRKYDDVVRIDTSATLPDGTKIANAKDLEDAILEKPEMFINTLASKLMTYALGRHVSPNDGPEIRDIVRKSGEDDYRLSTIIEQIVLSKPFQYRSLE